MNRNKLKQLVKYHENKEAIGIYSACTANEIVIRSVIRNSKKNNCIAVVESTANQCNQFGGYTGMKPQDFKDMVFKIATEEGFDTDDIILGGDHLGPLTWMDKEEDEAMELSKELIRQYVSAGFTKIHLDTSMRLVGDDEFLSDETIARRSAVLAKVAKDTFESLKKENENAIKPVFIVGSEVPIPGGAQDSHEISVTKVEDVIDTVNEFKKQYEIHDVLDIWEDVIAVVVQPGVEFGDTTIDEYNRENASELMTVLEGLDLVFEGHSTDYQTQTHLSEMVEDGIKILKVGPGLTFALREGLFALAQLESDLLKYTNTNPSNLIEVIEKVMIEDDQYWSKYYQGTKNEQFIKRKYSFSDRVRYYLPYEEVDKGVKVLLKNLSTFEIPLSLLSQYMPNQYTAVRNGEIQLTPEELLMNHIDETLDVYVTATNQMEVK